MGKSFKTFSSLIKNRKIAGPAGIVVLLALALGAVYYSRTHESATYPQGGMWMPQQMAAHEETLKKMGLTFPIAGISDPAQEPLSASVFLGGCSASFISPSGLIITNHHCVVGILNHMGKDGKDYQKNGFLAASQKDERPAPPTQKAYVTLSFEDVTEVVREGLELIPDPVVRADTVEKRVEALIAEREAAEKKVDDSIYVEVKSYYRDSKYLLIRKKEIKDVRMVYAPADSIGRFGGDIDNWHWPRHTGDFALLRAYVAKDGKSVPYRADNVPLSSPHFLKMPSEPLKQGDLVFVMGYPGATERWETAKEVKKEIDVNYPHTIERTRGLIQALEKFENDADPQTQRVAKGLLPRPRNYLPLWEGELAGMKDWNVLGEKESEHTQLIKWIESSDERRARYGSLLENPAADENSAQTEETKVRDRSFKEFLYWGFHSRPPAHLLRNAFVIARLALERAKPDDKRDSEYRQRNWESLRAVLGQTYQDQMDIRVEKAILEYFLGYAQKAGNQDLLEAITGNRTPSSEQIRTSLDEIYAKTDLLKLDRRLALFDKVTVADISKSTDPAIRVARALVAQWKGWKERADQETGKDVLEMALWAEARSQFLATPQSPDANATQRITFGTVRSFRPSPWKSRYPTFTYATEIATKSTGKSPFDAPQEQLDEIRRKNFGPYADATGDLPINFVSDLDITGGNSGSPVINRKGELVGVAFDGVWEALVSDKKFLPTLSRTIAVDIRYFLWTLDAVDSGDWILGELGQKKHFTERSASNLR